jgi:hypothetical protein
MNLPMGKEFNRFNVRLNHYTLSPTHVIQIMENHSDDIPCGSELDMYVAIESYEKVENGVKGLKSDYYIAQVWRSRPLLSGIVDSMGKKQGIGIINCAIKLQEEVFRTNPVVPPGASSVDVSKQEIDAFQMANLYEEQIVANRSFRQSLDD